MMPQRVSLARSGNSLLLEVAEERHDKRYGKIDQNTVKNGYRNQSGAADAGNCRQSGVRSGCAADAYRGKRSEVLEYQRCEYNDEYFAHYIVYQRNCAEFGTFDFSDDDTRDGVVAETGTYRQPFCNGVVGEDGGCEQRAGPGAQHGDQRKQHQLLLGGFQTSDEVSVLSDAEAHTGQQDVKRIQGCVGGDEFTPEKQSCKHSRDEECHYYKTFLKCMP